MKIMFDSQIFDKLNSVGLSELNSGTDFEYYITAIQIEELASISDDKKEARIRNFLCLVGIRAKMVPTADTVLGVSRFGYSRFGNGEVYNEILNESKNNIADAMIAATAVFEKCTLVTDDHRLYNKMKKHNYDVISYDEFLNLFQPKY